MTEMTQKQISEISIFLLMKHVECVKLQKKLNISDEDIPCKLILNEHFKYFRMMTN